MRKRERGVFFTEAIRRILRQKPEQQLRSVPELIRVAVNELGFFVGNIVPLIPHHIVALRNRVVFDGYEVHGGDESGALIVFVHGGAWGGGSAWLHASMASGLSRALRSPVVVADQQVWPDAGMHEQARQVGEVVRKAKARFSDRKTVLVAHSSGAHSAAWALAEDTEVDVAVLQAGVYEPLRHYVHEGERGVEAVSPMSPAANADVDVRRLADVSIINRLRRLSSVSAVSSLMSPWHNSLSSRTRLLLEGYREASCVSLSETSKDIVSKWGARDTFIMAATEDIVVPLSSSVRLTNSLRRRGIAANLLLCNQTAHVDFVLNWARPWQLRREAVLDIDVDDKKRRIDAYTAAHGAPGSNCVRRCNKGCSRCSSRSRLISHCTFYLIISTLQLLLH